jgi:hypothetical protein
MTDLIDSENDNHNEVSSQASEIFSNDEYQERSLLNQSK